MFVISAGDSGEERALARRFECGEAEARAMIYGSVLASFNIEAFSLERLRALREEINARYQMFHAMSQFEPAHLDQPRSHGGRCGYHIIARGNRRERTLASDADCLRFRELLGELLPLIRRG